MPIQNPNPGSMSSPWFPNWAFNNSWKKLNISFHASSLSESFWIFLQTLFSQPFTNQAGCTQKQIKKISRIPNDWLAKLPGTLYCCFLQTGLDVPSFLIPLKSPNVSLAWLLFFFANSLMHWFFYILPCKQRNFLKFYPTPGIKKLVHPFLEMPNSDVYVGLWKNPHFLLKTLRWKLLSNDSWLFPSKRVLLEPRAGFDWNFVLNKLQNNLN